MMVGSGMVSLRSQIEEALKQKPDWNLLPCKLGLMQCKLNFWDKWKRAYKQARYRDKLAQERVM
jgi:hypothetical protein